MDTLIYIFRAAGIVAWPLFASSIAAVAPIVERLAFWFRVNRRQRGVVREVLQLYSQNPDSAIKKLQVNGDLPLARIFLEALELDSPNIEEFRLALLSGAQAEIPESYTSKASALDGDELPVRKTKSDVKPVFSGKRVKRGLYKTNSGRTINADTNGSMNIARKVIPNFMDGIVGLPFIPIVLGLWTKITNVDV